MNLKLNLVKNFFHQLLHLQVYRQFCFSHEVYDEWKNFYSVILSLSRIQAKA